MVSVTENVEGLFRPNGTLERTVFNACREDGFGFFQSWGASARVRRMKPEARQELEKQLGVMVLESVDAGTLQLPRGAEIVGGIVVSGWQDLFTWFMENLPAILEMIATIIALF